MTIEDPRTRNPFDREALARRALELHGMKYNCAQAVACTLAPLIGADEELCFRAAEGLGGGMGGLTETCGAVSGAAMPHQPGGQQRTRQPHPANRRHASVLRARELVPEQTAPTLCPELKGIKTKQPLRSCDGCIVDALQLAADALAGLPADKPLDA